MKSQIVNEMKTIIYTILYGVWIVFLLYVAYSVNKKKASSNTIEEKTKQNKNVTNSVKNLISGLFQATETILKNK